MNTTKNEIPVAGNPETRAAFRRRVWLRIYLPMLLAFMLVIMIPVSIGIASYGTTSIWADTSLIFLSIPMLIVGLVAFALMLGFVYLVSLAIVKLPLPAAKLQQIFKIVQAQLLRITNASVRPVISLRAIAGTVASKKGQNEEPREQVEVIES